MLKHVLTIYALPSLAARWPISAVDYDASIAIPEAAAGVDIVGIRLGMTPQEAQGAVKAHEAELRVEVRKGRVPQADGTSGEFPSKLAAARPHPNFETINVVFTEPPRDQRVVSIHRVRAFAEGSHRNRDTVRQALIDKHNPPTREEQPQGGNWTLTCLLEKDKAECGPIQPDRKRVFPTSLGKGQSSDGCSANLVVAVRIYKGFVADISAALVDPRLSVVAWNDFHAFGQATYAEQRRRAAENAPAPTLQRFVFPALLGNGDRGEPAGVLRHFPWSAQRHGPCS